MILVREEIEFQRGGDARKRIGIGRNPIKLRIVNYWGEDVAEEEYYERLTPDEVQYLLNNWTEVVTDAHDFGIEREDGSREMVEREELEEAEWVLYMGKNYKIV